MTRSTDANGHATVYSGFGPTGYPSTITDPLTNPSTFDYDARGNVLKVTNAKGAQVTQSYDTFGRPLEEKEPKDQAAGVFITTPAPVYDASDNITRATGPNGTATTSVFDEADQLTESTAPGDLATDPVRRTTTTYDKVGNVLTVTDPKGNATATAGDYTTTTAYDAIYQPVRAPTRRAARSRRSTTRSAT
ncbi:hypothetical protein ACWD0A_07215 [Streptomyces sp. NPDC002867]